MHFSTVLFNVSDMIGCIAFALSGAMTGLKYRLDVFGITVLGVMTALGGGMIRDLFVQRMPGVLHKHVYAVAVLIGALVYLTLFRRDVSDLIATPVTILLVFTIRMLATRYRWNLPKAW